jgi:hypothetical protein
MLNICYRGSSNLWLEFMLDVLNENITFVST